MEGKSSTNQTVTLGLPNYFSSYRLSDGSLVNVQIMDTAGMEVFRAINTSYYRSANCCLLVYDITDKTSFEDCKTYFNPKIKEFCNKDIPVILLGNKTDLENDRKVKPEDGANFALKNNYIFMETSCLKNTNVADAFEALIELTNRELMKKDKNKNDEDKDQSRKITLSKKDVKEKRKICYF